MRLVAQSTAYQTVLTSSKSVICCSSRDAAFAIASVNVSKTRLPRLSLEDAFKLVTENIRYGADTFRHPNKWPNKTLQIKFTDFSRVGFC